jgi:hypothetical protein
MPLPEKKPAAAATQVMEPGAMPGQFSLETLVLGNPEDAPQEQVVEETETPEVETTETETPEAETQEVEAEAETEQTEEEAPAETEETETEAKPAAKKKPEAKQPTPEEVAAQQSAEFGRNVHDMLETDPELALTYLKSLKKRHGALAPHLQARMTALEEQLKPAAPEKKEPPPLSDADFKAQYQALVRAGKEDEAAEFYHKHKVAPEMAKLRSTIDEEATRRKKEAEEGQRVQTQQTVAAAAQREIQNLAKVLPDEVSIDAEGRVTFKDQDFHRELVAATKGVSAGVSLDDAACVAALRVAAKKAKKSVPEFTRDLMKQLAKPRPQPQPKVTQTGLAKKGSTQVQTKPGEFALDITVSE